MSKNNNTLAFKNYVIFHQANLNSDRLFAIRKEQFKRIHLLEKEYGSLYQIPSKEIVDCHEIIYNEKECEYILESNKRVIAPINRLQYQDYIDNVL